MDSRAKKKLAVAIVLIVVACLGLGILIGYFIGARSPSPSVSYSCVPCARVEEDKTITDKLLVEVKAENIRNYLYNMTRKAHTAGTDEGRNSAQRLYDIWKNEHKLDSVSMPKYDVLLSYPAKDSPSKVELKDKQGRVVFTSRLQEEKDLTPNQPLDPEASPPFLAYAKTGDVEGELVFANYCQLQDFDGLEQYLQTQNSKLEGKIVICKYGMIGRMDMLKNVADRKGVGMIMYFDPMDYAPDGESVYPDSLWLPPTGVQRGSVLLTSGDPQTPLYPSIESAYRLPVENITDLPQIPALPIGYGDAEVLMASMVGREVPDDWQGGMNITYRYGPGHVNGTRTRLYVNNSREVRPIYNVIGVIRGRVEPDRYVILGNHRDAWVYGAADPTSGTAAMLELTRVFSELVRNGWRPMRSIVFCSWDAEEYALGGSYEWVEEYIANLASRTVAYLNLDTAVNGNSSLGAVGNPLLFEALYAATKKISDPHGGTLYDRWMQSVPNNKTHRPMIWPLGASSDYASFLIRAGIPSLDAGYEADSFPLYHSVYETFYFLETFVDPSFAFHRAVTQLWGEVARSLADSLILPLDVTSHSETLTSDFEDLLDQFGQKWTQHQVNISALQDAVRNFATVTAAFTARVKSVDRTDPIAVRRINDQMMLLERAFIDPRGLPGRPQDKHVIFSQSLHDTYSGVSFPGLVDAMWNIDSNPDPARYEEVKKQISILAFIVQSAASTLVETHIFPR